MVSNFPSIAHSLRVWISRRICSNSKVDLTSPLASPQNIKASSESGECPSRILVGVAVLTVHSLLSICFESWEGTSRSDGVLEKWSIGAWIPEWPHSITPSLHLRQTGGVPRKPSVSPSKITTYLACPVKYRYTYVDDRARWLLRAKSYYSFGTTLHRVLQRFHDSGDVGVTTTAEVLAAYEESWIDAGFNSAEEMAEAFGEGKEILERHVATTLAMPEVAKTLFVERQLRQDFGDFVLIGRIDRVDEYEDGTLEIVDYKSGRASVSEEDVASDIAMCCYQLLLRHKYPDRPIRARILALRSSESATHAMSPTEFVEFERDISLLARMILSENFYERKPVRKPICDHCDFCQPVCKTQISRNSGSSYLKDISTFEFATMSVACCFEVF